MRNVSLKRQKQMAVEIPDPENPGAVARDLLAVILTLVENGLVTQEQIKRNADFIDEHMLRSGIANQVPAKDAG